MIAGDLLVQVQDNFRTEAVFFADLFCADACVITVPQEEKGFIFELYRSLISNLLGTASRRDSAQYSSLAKS